MGKVDGVVMVCVHRTNQKQTKEMEIGNVPSIQIACTWDAVFALHHARPDYVARGP